MAALRFLLGVAHGLGMPPSLALVSETSPENSRMLLQFGRQSLSSLGMIGAAVSILFDDSTFEHLHWRLQGVIFSLPPLVCGLAGYFFILESPVFLANRGSVEQAQQILLEMRRLNGMDGSSGPEVDLLFDTPRGNTPRGAGGGGQPEDGPRNLPGDSKFAQCFSKNFFWMTMALAFMSFTSNLQFHGMHYSFAQVAVNEADYPSPGAQLVSQSLLGMAFLLPVGFIGIMLSRKSASILGLAVGTIWPILFAWSLATGLRTNFEALVYYVSQNLPMPTLNLLFMTTTQLSVDLYPSQIASTSAAIAVGFGRPGAMVAPLAFEGCGGWGYFYGLLSAFASASCLGVMAFVPEKREAIERLEETSKLV
jgi:MFS family permease